MHWTMKRVLSQTRVTNATWRMRLLRRLLKRSKVALLPAEGFLIVTHS